ncbi:MAG: hypothetical protein ACOCTQ_04395 [Planctomycetota bacterium]
MARRWKNFYSMPFHVVLLMAFGVLLYVAPVIQSLEEDRRDVPSFTCELEEPGQVSAAVYDEDGRLVRELPHAERLRARTLMPRIWISTGTWWSSPTPTAIAFKIPSRFEDDR